MADPLAQARHDLAVANRVVFARGVNPQVATLLKKLDEATEQNGKASMGSFAVFCSDQEGLDGTLKDLAGKQGLKKLVLALDNPAGPQGYDIARDADVTVVLYNEFTVRANHAFKSGALNQKSIDTIVADVSKIVLGLLHKPAFVAAAENL